MGRKCKNKTYEQILAEGRIRAKKYYQLHKEEVKKKAMEKYNELKQESLNRKK